MSRISILPLLGLLALGACDTNTGNTTLGTLGVPEGQPLAAAQIRALVQGGPYDVRIYDGEFAGTVGRSTWDFEAMRLTGSYRTADGETGSYDMPVSIEGNQLCAGEDDWKQCHLVYPYEGGFMEVTPSGGLHATSVPL
ncbi:hypothetical protein [Limimaricola pyoseonensis]|uniref:Lipoprotein n=1 Tax=Limimaricola pyoseonensis TaxID=521013 RepID=A0A1G7B5B5_9RHOB|nr:hypothetical protein [Limimaricola pyoseonensis]SDE21496.1 hypothetical protein SAMN04488567_1232 [Limimaricola pyoseonensis]